LAYLATAILRITSLDHTIQQKRSRDRSLPEPVFGIAEGRDGVLIGNKELGHDAQGVVVVMEIRRKSGRGVRETFVLAPASSSLPSALEAAGKMKTGPSAGSSILLLDDHPLYAAPEVGESALDADEGEDGPESTFNLGLTEKQKKDREGVVLPYFDAQNGGTEGGRILYEMGREDDWDPEEDEI
jgi:elongator complex protein 5